MGERTKPSVKLNSNLDRAKNLQPKTTALAGDAKIIKKAKKTEQQINQSPIAALPTKKKYTEKINTAVDKITGKPNIEIFGNTCDKIVESFEKEAQALKDYTTKAQNFLDQVGQAKQNIKKYKDLEDTTILKDNESSLVLVPQNHTSVVKDYRDIELRIGGNGGKKEEKIQGPKIIAAYKNHLNNQKKLLADCPDKSSQIYQVLFKDYQAALQAYLNACGNFGDENERGSCRNTEQMVVTAQEILRNTNSPTEALDWVKKMFAMLDDDTDWLINAKQRQSLMTFSQVCAAELKSKMVLRQAEIISLTEGPEKKAALAQLINTGTEMAELYTDRKFPMDKTMIDIDFASETLRNILMISNKENIYNKHFAEAKPNYDATINEQINSLVTTVQAKNPNATKESIVNTINEATGTNISIINSIEDFTKNYILIRSFTAQFKGDQTTKPEHFYAEVQPFITEQFNTVMTKYNTTGKVEKWLGITYTSEEKKAFDLLSDIEGYKNGRSDKRNAELLNMGKQIGLAVVIIAVSILATPAAGAAVLSLSTLATAAAAGAAVNVAGEMLLERKISTLFSEGDFSEASFQDLVKTHGTDAVVGAVAGTVGKIVGVTAGPRVWASYMAHTHKYNGGFYKATYNTLWGKVIQEAGGAGAEASLDTDEKNSVTISVTQQMILKTSLYNITEAGILGKIEQQYDLNTFIKLLPNLQSEHFFELSALLQNIQNSYSKLHTIARKKGFVKKGEPLKDLSDKKNYPLDDFEPAEQKIWKKERESYLTLSDLIKTRYIIPSQNFSPSPQKPIIAENFIQ